MLFKMLLIERAYKLHDEVPKPRQVFVTKSRILAQKVQEYFEKLAVTLDRTSMTAQQLKDASSVANDKADATPQALVANNDLGWRADLPRRFSELEDKHFPLFITFDEVSTCCFSFVVKVLILAVVRTTGSRYPSRKGCNGTDCRNRKKDDKVRGPLRPTVLGTLFGNNTQRLGCVLNQADGR